MKGYRLDDRYYSIPSKGRIVLFAPRLTGSGVHPVSNPVGTAGSFFPLEQRRPGREGDHSSSSTIEVNSTWIFTSTSPIHPHVTVIRYSDNLTNRMMTASPMGLIFLLVSLPRLFNDALTTASFIIKRALGMGG